jgi:hypothetical protein
MVRTAMTRLRARHVVEANAGAMREWGVRKGAWVEIVVHKR